MKTFQMATREMKPSTEPSEYGALQGKPFLSRAAGDVGFNLRGLVLTPKVLFTAPPKKLI
jgi:hypothetical protein